MSFVQNIDSLYLEILRAQRRSPHSSSKVRILVATKGRSIDEINTALGHEQVTLIGENRLQEAEKKIPRLKKSERHFIGNIQSRKIPKIVELFDGIESVCDVFHAEKISREAKELNKTIKIFVEVSLSGETQKSGVLPQKVDEFLSQVSRLENIELQGLMTMARFGASEGELRKTFSTLRKIREQYLPFYPNLTELSMGMSDDFKIAVEEGATIVRLGRIVFIG